MRRYSKEEINNQLQNILNQYNQSAHLSPTQSQSHIQTQMSRDLDNLDEIPTIEMKVYSFDVLGSNLYVVTQSNHLPYIQQYIDSINAGNPDKDSVIRKYAIEYQKMSESILDRMLSQVKTSIHSGYTSLPIRIIGELNRIESDLKPLLDAQKRDQKIENILNGGIQENEE
jgi:hypothetical protein